MKKIIISVILTLLANVSFATTNELIVDQYFSPYVGSALNLTVFHDYMFLDDQYLYSTEGKKSCLWALGRTLKLVYESALSDFLMVVQHEVFGHGYRLREFGVWNIGYDLGIGTGATYFSEEDFEEMSSPRRAALSAAGMEANAVLAAQIRQNWLLDSKIDRREALLYLASALDQAEYILGTTNESENLGNDVNSYVIDVNSWYGNTALSKHKLHNYALWDLLDINLYLAVYSIGVYIIDSNPHISNYMFDIYGYKYLFTPRLLLAPYGPEFQVQNYVITKNSELLQVNVRYGNNTHIQSYGVDFFMRPIWKYKNATFGNKLYLWRQPKYLTQNTATGVKQSLGIADFVGVECKIYKEWAVIGEFGYKTAGYVIGNPLGNSWVWRLGISRSF